MVLLLLTSLVVAEHSCAQAASRLPKHNIADAVAAAGAGCSYCCRYITAWWAGVAGVHAQHVEHIPARRCMRDI